MTKEVNGKTYLVFTDLRKACEYKGKYKVLLEGDADFRNTDIKDSGKLEIITGNVDFSDSIIESLPKLKTINGYANFRNSRIKNLPNLVTINGDVDFTDSKIPGSERVRLEGLSNINKNI